METEQYGCGCAAAAAKAPFGCGASQMPYAGWGGAQPKRRTKKIAGGMFGMRATLPER